MLSLPVRHQTVSFSGSPNVHTLMPLQNPLFMEWNELVGESIKDFSKEFLEGLSLQTVQTCKCCSETVVSGHLAKRKIIRWKFSIGNTNIAE